MLDIIKISQAERIRKLHPDWEEDRVMKLAGIWARRARRIFWGGVSEQEAQIPITHGSPNNG